MARELGLNRAISSRVLSATSKKDPLEGRETVARKKDEPTYYGIKVFSRSLGYVLDISGSMI